jgi:hypothetical protein
MSTLTMLALLAGAAMTSGGCAVFAWTAAAFAPPQKVKPVFEFPRGKKVLVFVDSDYPLSYEPVKSQFTEEISRQLLENKIAASTVPYPLLQNLLDAPSQRTLSVSEVGAKAGAEMVLYVKVEKFSVKDEESTPLWIGRMSATVRVVEVGKGRIWPKDQGEFILPAMELHPVDELSPSYGQQVAQELAVKMGDRIAKLFYEHTVPNTGQEPDAPL